MYRKRMCVKGGVCSVCGERMCGVGSLALTIRQAYLSAVHPLEDWEENVIYLALVPPHPILCKPRTPQLRKSTTASVS